MAITAFTSTAIIDATTIGTTVLTALSEGIAADAIGLGTTDSPTFADGTFTGTVQTEYITGVNGKTTDANLYFRPSFGHLFIKSGASNVARFASTGVLYYANVSPQTSGLYDMGTSIQRWRSVGSVDGSFTGNLVSEVGGSQIVYGSYTDASNYERLRTSYDGVQYVIQTEQAGSGVAKRLQLKVGNSVRFAGDSAFTYLYGASGGYVYIGGGYFRPQTGQSIEFGGASNRWANVYSEDGNFSGDVVMAGNVDFTGLPTSNPLLAGRLWNDSGTMKISAG